MKLSIEKEDYTRFVSAYEKLENKNNIFYVYFTTKLLHYALESTKFVPKTANLVVITGGLEQGEIDFISREFSIPVIHLSKRYNDGHIWEMLFDVNRNNFGWMDVDCFVSSPKVFEDLVKIDEQTAINTIWARKHEYYGIDAYFANTFMQFINIKIAKYIMDKYPKLNLTPIYINQEVVRWYEVPRFLEEDEKALLLSAFPRCGENKKGFDTTHYYQLLVMLEGFKIHRVRELDPLAQYYSEEALHLGGCNMIHTYPLDKTPRRIFYRFNMRFSYYLLKKYFDKLPDCYGAFKKEFDKTMEINKLSTDTEDLVLKINEYIQRNGIRLNVEIGEEHEETCTK